MMLPGGVFFFLSRNQHGILAGRRRFGDSSWVLNVEAEVVETAGHGAMVLGKWWFNGI